MGIGRIADIPSSNIYNALHTKRNYTEEEIEAIYKKIKAGTGISYNGVPFEQLDRRKQIEFNNKIVNALNSISACKKREGARSRFKPGDAVKFDIDGKHYKAFVHFDKKGKVMLTNDGRYRGFNFETTFTLTLNGCTTLEGEEYDEFLADYNSKMRPRILKQIEGYKDGLKKHPGYEYYKEQLEKNKNLLAMLDKGAVIRKDYYYFE